MTKHIQHKISGHFIPPKCPMLIQNFGEVGTRLIHQLHYWLAQNNTSYGIFHDNLQWIRNSYNDWHKQIPEYAPITIRRAFTKLINEGIILAKSFSEHKYLKGGDSVKSYTIDYNALEKRVGDLSKTLLNNKQLKNTTHGTSTKKNKNLNQSYNAEFIATVSLQTTDQMITPPDQMITPLNKEYISNKQSNKFSFADKKINSFWKNEKSIEQNSLKKKIAETMISHWDKFIKPELSPTTLTSKRIYFLYAAYQEKFKGNIDLWIEFCQKLTTSKYLMGETEKRKEKIDLDWALKFENIQILIDGSRYNFGDRIHPSSLKQQNKHNTLNSQNSYVAQYETEETILIRQNLKRKIKAHSFEGIHDYLSWISDSPIVIEEENGAQNTILYVKDHFIYDSIYKKYADICKEYFTEVRIGFPHKVQCDHHTTSSQDEVLTNIDQTSDDFNEKHLFEQKNSVKHERMLIKPECISEREEIQQPTESVEGDPLITDEFLKANISPVTEELKVHKPKKIIPSVLSEIKILHIHKQLKKHLPQDIYEEKFKESPIRIQEGRAFFVISHEAKNNNIYDLYNDIIEHVFDGIIYEEEITSSDQNVSIEQLLNLESCEVQLSPLLYAAEKGEEDNCISQNECISENDIKTNPFMLLESGSLSIDAYKNEAFQKQMYECLLYEEEKNPANITNVISKDTLSSDVIQTKKLSDNTFIYMNDPPCVLSFLKARDAISLKRSCLFHEEFTGVYLNAKTRSKARIHSFENRKASLVGLPFYVQKEKPPWKSHVKKRADNILF